MLGRIGVPELVIIAVIVMFIFGPSRIPKLARSFGETVREFRKVRAEVSAVHDEVASDLRDINRAL